jgi:hypothetical protein
LHLFPRVVLALLLVSQAGCLFAHNGTQTPSATPTAQILATPSLTLSPSEAALPLTRLTASPTPTKTRTPTATKMPTPTKSPTVTLTPIPVVFKDDFSKEDRSVWAGCTSCVWRDNRLVIGPYTSGEESDLPHLTICEACGEHTFYRVAVDTALLSGQDDHSFGLVIASNQNELVMLGIDASQNCIVARYAASIGNWQLLDVSPAQVWNELLKRGKQVNHLEVLVKPSTKKAGTADYTINLNGSTSFVIAGQPAAPSKVGLLVDTYDLQVSFANFEYDELRP